jgi:hypothetical protein
MDTELEQYLSPVENPDGRHLAVASGLLYMGPLHQVEESPNTCGGFPSVSAIVNESRHQTGIQILPQHESAFDEGWRQALQTVFSQHPNNPTVASELEDYLATGLSNGRKLRLQIMVFPPGLYFRMHCHPNIEFEVTLKGSLQEFRWASFTVPADQVTGDAPTGPEIAATQVFEQRAVNVGQCLLNEIGSVHQSFTGSDGPCVLLHLWSGVHANIQPYQVQNKDKRLRPNAGWEDDGDEQAPSNQKTR